MYTPHPLVNHHRPHQEIALVEYHWNLSTRPARPLLCLPEIMLCWWIQLAQLRNGRDWYMSSQTQQGF